VPSANPGMFSIIVCSNRPALAEAVRRHYATLFESRESEFILIDDATSLSEGYTRGVQRSRGEHLVFSHDDVEFVSPDVALRLRQHLRDHDVVGIAGATRMVDGAWFDAGDPYTFGLVIYPDQGGQYTIRYVGAGPRCVSQIHALDGCFIACRREVAETVGFDAETFDGFHFYDVDFTFRAHLRGYRLAVCRDLALIHASQGNFDDTWQRYRERFEAKHAGRLAPGAPAPMRVVGARLRKDQLAAFCESTTLPRAIGSG